MTDQANTLTLDGVTHEVSKFSKGVQNAISIYNQINADLQKEQLAVIKSQSALSNIGAQIADAVRKELAAAQAPAEGAEAVGDVTESNVL